MIQDIKYWFINIFRSIKNVVYYLPVICEDRDWDNSYLEYIILAKYKKWYKRFSKPDLPLMYVGIEKDVQAMRILINILERRKNDWYTDIWYNKYSYKEKFVSTPIEGASTFKLTTTGLTAEESKKSLELLKLVDKTEERDWKIFCNILNKYHNRMWD